ncbi:glyoxalase [Streptomyces abyssalis]|uniref:Glyoxalase n=1 Tax=Streptomyces abyssalis TaxID=933944 RepID=A0A1E7JPB7_9ACTN|nr:VOC family protein [Streptomyces abyssalis]OEU86502.1 glyoxalase [Streptomyces abyssalis]OEU90108.1 glyoxalase [Streptomyces abyssalis]
MTLEWEQVLVDAEDPAKLGRWWAEALGWAVVDGSAETTEGGASGGEFEIRPSPDRLPGLLFVHVPERKTGKNRLHLDFRPDDQEAEVARLLAHGARHADVGQSEEDPWVVLADPEGNEFCVLGPRRQ